MKVVPLVVVGLALLVAVRAQDEESQESKDAAEAKEPKASAGPSKLAPTVSYAGLHSFLHGAELTRTPRRLRWVRTGYAYQPPALDTYRRRRAACPQGPAYCTYWVRVPASAVPYVSRTVAPQASTGC